MADHGGQGWIGVDLDGTLAHYDGWKGPEHIGEPIPLMVKRVKRWLAEGKDVRIFTARVDGGEVAAETNHADAPKMRDVATVRSFIEAWCLEHLGRVLPVTNRKDYGMIQLWDDRCVQVEENTGRTIEQAVRAEMDKEAREAARDGYAQGRSDEAENHERRGGW